MMTKTYHVNICTDTGYMFMMTKTYHVNICTDMGYMFMMTKKNQSVKQINIKK